MTTSPRLRRILRFARDRRGVAVIEFAFIAPVLIFFYFGMAETCQLLMAQRRVSHAAAALADLVTQDTTIGNEEVEQLYEAACTIMRPFPTADRYRIRLTSAEFDAAQNRVEVRWSEDNGRGLPSWPVDSVFLAETPLTANGDGVIIAEIEYQLVSPIQYFLPGTTRLYHKAEMRPRRSASVARVAGAAGTSTAVKVCSV